MISEIATISMAWWAVHAFNKWSAIDRKASSVELNWDINEVSGLRLKASKLYLWSAIVHKINVLKSLLLEDSVVWYAKYFIWEALLIYWALCNYYDVSKKIEIPDGLKDMKMLTHLSIAWLIGLEAFWQFKSVQDYLTYVWLSWMSIWLSKSDNEVFQRFLRTAWWLFMTWWTSLDIYHAWTQAFWEVADPGMMDYIQNTPPLVAAFFLINIKFSWSEWVQMIGSIREKMNFVKQDTWGFNSIRNSILTNLTKYTAMFARFW